MIYQIKFYTKFIKITQIQVQQTDYNLNAKDLEEENLKNVYKLIHLLIKDYLAILNFVKSILDKLVDKFKE